MNWVGFLPRRVVPLVGLRRWRPADAAVREATGLSESQWREMGGRFPALGKTPGADALRARRMITLAAAIELARRRPRPNRTGPALDPAPTLYLTIHLGNLRLLRYLLRAGGLAAATVVDQTHLGNPQGARVNAWVDRRFPVDFPHTFFSGAPHRLRSALRRGSLIAAVDRIHARPSARPDALVSIPFLGGSLPLDLGVLRLARLAGAPARPLFLTAPRGRLTITAGEPVDARDPAEAARQFALVADAAARESPADFDAYTHRFLLASPAPPEGVDFEIPF